jgi:transposase-like protein
MNNFWKEARIGRENDRRRKVTDEQRMEMRELYNNGASISQISRDFGVSRMAVYTAVDKEKMKQHYANVVEKQRRRGRTTKERRDIARKYRDGLVSLHGYKYMRKTNRTPN